ncbi:long-chain-alcoholO-fatty-acyl transferase [Haloferula helveola]|uniref:Long-chain-alcoholO-fatty-acyl transferase n=2 Tax=Haloferula helveola TaxID=490095 RepID=A0ABN6H7T9_9BACT|nr:long-chain-alcoholO-fatty-acyl transferase [Haloferula helveola]
MWAIAVVMFAVLKAASFWWERGGPASSPRKLAYLFLWPGMDARAFLSAKEVPPPSSREWLAAGFKTVLGIVLLVLATRLEPPLLSGWCAMVGIIFLLHFGAFHLLSCFWRSRGIDAVPLMNRPLLATSVSGFWGRHWNIAFRDLTHRMVFKPVLRRHGGSAAVLAGFLFSGILHELAITVPAGGGYGLPTVFFMIQGVAALVERSAFGKRCGLGASFRGWTFTQGLLALTVALLFPPPFVLRIIYPFLEFLHRPFA